MIFNGKFQEKILSMVYLLRATLGCAAISKRRMNRECESNKDNFMRRIAILPGRGDSAKAISLDDRMSRLFSERPRRSDSHLIEQRPQKCVRYYVSVIPHEWNVIVSFNFEKPFMNESGCLGIFKVSGSVFLARLGLFPRKTSILVQTNVGKRYVTRV
jgi:hypothetical protein